MVQLFSCTNSLVVACLALAAAAHSERSTTTSESSSSSSNTSSTSKTSPAATGLNFEVPEPLSAPGTNTSSGCGKELDSHLTIDDTAGPFEFDTSDGYGRNYTIYIPKYYDINKASPLIFGLPGNAHTYEDIEQQTQLSDEANNPYAIAVYVSGYNLGFASNPGYGATEDAIYPTVDDLDFLENFIDDLQDRFCIDMGRVWAVGHSNGAGLTNVLACDPVMSTRITAFAANAGAFYTNHTAGDPETVVTDTTLQAECSPGREHVPYIEFHGTDDDVIPYNGTDNHFSNGIRILPDVQHWASDWAVRNGYSTDNETSKPADNVTMYQWGGPDNLGVVTHYKLSGWIHDYPRKSAGAPIDATPIIMKFFYELPNYTKTSTTTTSSTPTSTSSATSTPSAAAGRRSAKPAGTSLLAAIAGLAVEVLFH